MGAVNIYIVGVEFYYRHTSGITTLINLKGLWNGPDSGYKVLVNYISVCEGTA